jgi:hypothetical protein
VEWVAEKFNVDLSLVSRLGGHSQPRTHRGKEQFPGMTITYALMVKLEDICKATPHKAQIISKANVKSLIYKDGAVVGVNYEKGGSSFTAHGPVVLATVSQVNNLKRVVMLLTLRKLLCLKSTDQNYGIFLPQMGTIVPETESK